MGINSKFDCDFENSQAGVRWKPFCSGSPKMITKPFTFPNESFMFQKSWLSCSRYSGYNRIYNKMLQRLNHTKMTHKMQFYQAYDHKLDFHTIL